MNVCTSLPSRQHGAVLVIGLIFLAALSLLGVANMNSSSMQLRLASNYQNKNRAFQVAESVIAVTIDTIDYTNIRSAQHFGATNHPQYPDADATVSFVERTTAAGCRGTSFNFSCVHFEIDSTGSDPDSGARSTQVQGVYRVAPSL